MLQVEHGKANIEILRLSGYVVVAGSDRVGFLVLEIVVDKGRPKATTYYEANYAGAHNVVDPSLL